MTAANPYSRLAPFIREYIYEKKWNELRDIQEAAIGEVLDGTGHILIASGTASGKTEAAFFPILSLIAASPGNSARVLYIGPLKALINDQFERLKDLLALGKIPLWRWHGDVANSHKKKLLENPSGILQITPESLEALLLRHPEKAGRLFGDLAFIVIDEVHAFMGSDRGAQLLCQISRIESASGALPRRVGLSATLGDYGEAAEWLAAGSGKKTVFIKEEKSKKAVSLSLDYFFGEGAKGSYYEELYSQCRNRKCVIFTNSRPEAEETIAAIREIAAARKEEDRCHVHHGSISAILREETEKKLRETEGPMTTAATTTLELGIDIGRLDRIIQIGAPQSAAGFVQRLGRSGRRTGRPEIYFSALEEGGESLPDAIPWPLLRTIAIIQLYLDEKWTEGVYPRPLPFSLLCHQTLSVLASLGEHRPADLARRLLSLPPFRKVPEEDYRELLLHLVNRGYLQKTSEGTLITGLEGERLTGHYSFYTVFPGEEEYRVVFGGRELGTVNFLPPEGSAITLAGRCWRIEAVDLRKRELIAVPGGGTGTRVWRGGSAVLHSRVAERMRRVLAEENLYPYLTKRAEARLLEARRKARQCGLTESIFIPEDGAPEPSPARLLGGRTPNRYGFFLIPWLGSRGMRTLQVILQNPSNRKGLKMSSLYRENEYVFRILSGLEPELFAAELRRLIENPGKPENLLEPDRIPFTDKYDYLLPPRLLLKQYAANMLDHEELKNLIPLS
jgi:ATP-dependent Lhr-like helicase